MWTFEPSIAHVGLAAGACLGGFASGLTGFGYGLVALSIWLHVLPPQIAAPLTVLCAVAAQALTLPRIWRFIPWRRAMPFILAGLVGVPIGAELLVLADPRVFKMLLGLFLVGYAGVMLLFDRSRNRAWGSERADAAIGFASGILGGFSGLSGVLMVVWAAVGGWNKDEKRGIFQAFNAAMLVGSAMSHAWRGSIISDVRAGDATRGRNTKRSLQ